MAITWESEDQGFYIIDNKELYVTLDRSEFLIATSKDLDESELVRLSIRYMEILWDLVDNYGYDTVDMLIFPKEEKVKFFQKDFTLGELVSISEINKKDK